MNNTFDINVKVETNMYAKIGNINTEVENAFKEMIDNSTTSFEDHRKELEQVGEKLCRVVIKWDDEQIVVSDNAYGMDKNTLIRAFGLGKEAEEYSEISRGQFGMGLKYSAFSFGDTVTIETTELGNDKLYKATLNAAELAKTKEETIKGYEYASDVVNHGTKITITNLKDTQKFSKFNVERKKVDELSKLIATLSRIYSLDLRMGKTIITINGNIVTYIPPVYMKNKETGMDELLNVSGSFNCDGKKYEYGGQIGWLKTGDTYNAGLSLMQQNRALVTSYRPETMFGDKKTYRFQRIYGEIKLLGENWKLTFTKNGINWDKQLEQTFLENLMDCEGVKELLKKVEKYRVKDDNTTVDDISKMGLDKKFGNLENNKQTQRIRNMNESTKQVETKPQEQTSKSQEIADDEYVIENIYNGTKYILHIIPKDIGEMKNLLYKTVQIKEGEYKLFVNTKVPYLKEFSTKDSNKLIVTMLVAKVLGDLEALKRGAHPQDIGLATISFNEIMSIPSK